MNFWCKTILLLFLASINILFAQDDSNPPRRSDTSYTSVATTRIYNMLKTGKAPRVTLQLSFNYDIGHLDLAGNENTYFSKENFTSGANFGTRYGYGVSLTGKISLFKAGFTRINVTAGYNRFQSNFVIAESPEGKVAYNVFSGSVGYENNFSPSKKIKPYIGLDIISSFISGNAVLSTDSADFDLKIKNSVRFGLALNLGFEYALSNKAGINMGYRITHANIIGKESKISANLNETFLNDEKRKPGEVIPYAGWKQFLYSTFYAGFNFYFGMKNKK